jgi:hypothetical protein
MGFNKKYVTKKTILDNLNNIDEVFRSDSLIMDTWASKFFGDLDKEERLIRRDMKVLYKEGSCPSTIEGFSDLKSLSESLISLYKSPSWFDIHLVQSRLGNLRVEDQDLGKIQILKERAIEAIVDYYEEDTK